MSEGFSLREETWCKILQKKSLSCYELGLLAV